MTISVTLHSWYNSSIFWRLEDTLHRLPDMVNSNTLMVSTSMKTKSDMNVHHASHIIPVPSYYIIRYKSRKFRMKQAFNHTFVTWLLYWCPSPPFGICVYKCRYLLIGIAITTQYVPNYYIHRFSLSLVTTLCLLRIHRL